MFWYLRLAPLATFLVVDVDVRSWLSAMPPSNKLFTAQNVAGCWRFCAYRRLEQKKN